MHSTSLQAVACPIHVLPYPSADVRCTPARFALLPAVAKHARLIVGLAVLSLASLTMTGCGAGFGEPSPKVSAITGLAVSAGQKDTLSITATGNGPFSYQWYRNGVLISGATGSSYSMVAASSDNGAVYTVSVANNGGSVTSAPFVLSVGVVGAPPTITTQPANQTATVGQPASFNVVAAGLSPLSYQWYENGVVISGATSSSYTTPATTLSQSGSSFSVTVTNAIGQTVSNQITMTVAPLSAMLAFIPVPAQTFGNAPVALSATSPSQGVVSYTVVSGPATLSGNMVTLTGAGTVVLGATQAAAGNYGPATASTTFQVAPEIPSLSFNVANHSFGSQPFAVNATSSSSGAITYAVVSGPATISGNTVTVTGAGTVVLSAIQAAGGNYTGATVTASFASGVETPTLSFNVPNQTYGSQPFAVNATSPSAGAISYSVTSGPATISGNTVTLTGTGTVVLAASQTAAGNYGTATASTSFTAADATPTVTFAVPNQTFGVAPFHVTATSASQGAVTYTVVSGPATVSGNTVSITGAGTVAMTASQAASGDYIAGTASTSFTVAPATPTLSFTAVTAQTYGNAAFPLSASSASTGAITYNVISGPATISGNTLTLTGAGTVVLGASQAASANYTSANATTSFNVGAETPALTFAAIPAQTYGGPTFNVSATSSSQGPVTYAVVSGPATVAGSTVTLTGAGTVVLSASQAAAGNYGTATATTNFTVGVETPTLAFNAISAETYGNAPFQVTASSASTGAVTYVLQSGNATVTPSGLVTLNGAGPIVITANQAAAGNYGTATANANFTVGVETPTLAFNTIPAETYGNTPFQVTATSASTGAVTYAVQSGNAIVTPSGLVTLNGAGPVVITANQAAAGNYGTATANANFTVGVETPTLAFNTIPAETYGNAPFQVTASSASTGAVSYSLQSGNATVTSSGLVTLNGAGPVVITANQAAAGNYGTATTNANFTVGVETPTLAFNTIPTETYGNAPFQVTASSASNGTVTYALQSGNATVTSSGTVTLNGTGRVVITASQVAAGNYGTATANANFTVGVETPTLTFNTIPAKTFGNPPFQVTATSASTGAVTYGLQSGNATVTPSGLVTLTGAGPVVLTASQVAAGNYGAATGGVSFNVTSNVTISAITPAGITIAPGVQTFNATATGGVTNNLIWSGSGGSFNGSVWTAPNLAGTFNIQATSVDEPTVSVATSITVSKPVITAQPVSKNACSGYNPSLSVAANYATSYQWYFDGNSLAVNSPTLTFANATTANSGTYTCSAINGAGAVSSNTVTLNVVNPTTLTITSQPSSVTVYSTQTATFSAGVTGTGTLTYQWYEGAVGSGTAINGATSSSYTTPALTTANSGSTYYVTVSDPDCTGSTVTSSAATLTVSNTDTAVPPTIVVQPSGETATVGGTATFSVTASGSGTLAYQWFRVAYSSTELSSPTAGILISGATSSTYTVPTSATAQSNDGDNYYVVVTNAYGQAVSSRVVLAVGAGIVLQLNSEPQTEYIAANTLATYSVNATCTGCIAAYQWYWYAPGSTKATVITNGASSGALAGAIVTGATTSSLTLSNVPTSATGGIVYVVVTSTSDGTNQVAGTNPLSSSTAGLFVGSLGIIGNPTAGEGLCNYGGNNWVLNGNAPGTVVGDVPYQNTSICTIQLVNDSSGERAAVYWPTLVSTAKFSVSFTVTLSATGTPADGFTMVLADPSQGATTASIGAVGEGIGADGIPGFVLGFDTYQNGYGNGASGCYTGSVPCDPAIVPYMAVGQGASALWENQWTFVNGFLNTQNSTDYTPTQFANSSHNYVVTVVNHVMTVTMDGYELFTGTVSLPPAAYLGFTASTGGSEESVTFSNMTATVSAP